jgi:hypothetical protein
MLSSLAASSSLTPKPKANAGGSSPAPSAPLSLTKSTNAVKPSTATDGASGVSDGSVKATAAAKSAEGVSSPAELMSFVSPSYSPNVFHHDTCFQEEGEIPYKAIC